MKSKRLLFLIMLVGLIAPVKTDGGVKPNNPNLSCGNRCTSNSCVKDLLTTATMYCYLTWSPLGCEGGTDPETCRPAAGG